MTGTGGPATVVVVAVGPAPEADPDLLRDLAAAEFAALGVPGRVVVAADAGELRGAVATAGADPAVALVVIPGPRPDVRDLMREPGPHAGRTVWLDLGRTGPVPLAAGGAHLYGRGVWGLAWAIRHAVHRLRRPARKIAYGDHADQWAELRLPAGPAPAAGAAPAGPAVAVLIHGGYWRSVWGADLMDALAIDLADRGLATWNLEYRRPDRHGWAATVADVAAGLSSLDTALDAEAGPVAVLGHSAGGQLACRVAADDPGRVALAVPLAGVLDLRTAELRGMGTGAVTAALGGPPAELPDAYAAADPLARLPLGVPQLVVQGRDDDPDLVDLNRRYARAAREAGDAVDHLELPGDHFAVIDPRAPIWRAAAERITGTLLRPSAPAAAA